MSIAHPGVGIVKDSKDNIYYTDLQQVWKITNGSRKVIIRDAHTHELWMDKNDDLYGEGSRYDAQSGKFYHCLWVYRKDGRIDTIIPMKEAYVTQDFSLARDGEGREYYTKRYLHTPDTTHIYRKSSNGVESVFAIGNFKDVVWLHPQQDGSVLYVSNNTIYQILADGRQMVIKKGVGNTKPLYDFFSDPTIWGLWQDEKENTYAAVFSDQAVVKIDKAGNMVPIYKSNGRWAPLHGVIDSRNRLWVLEGSDKNEVRVTGVNIPASKTETRSHLLPYGVIGALCIIGFIFYIKFKRVGISS